VLEHPLQNIASAAFSPVPKSASSTTVATLVNRAVAPSESPWTVVTARLIVSTRSSQVSIGSNPPTAMLMALSIAF